MVVEHGLRHMADGHLVDGGRMQVGGLFHQHKPPDHIFGGADPADPQAWRQGFGKTAAIDRAAVLDAAFARNFQRQHGRDRVAVETQGLIGGILDHGAVQIIGQRKNVLPCGKVERLAGGVGKINRGIGEFDAAPCGCCGLCVVIS